jgi:hypothetical protein
VQGEHHILNANHAYIKVRPINVILHMAMYLLKKKKKKRSCVCCHECILLSNYS